MKVSTLSALSALAGLTLAHPVDLSKRTNGGVSEIDITILQFALTVSTAPVPVLSSSYWTLD